MEGSVERGGAECERLAREIARLGVVCSAHVPTLMANAVIAYDEHRPAESQQMLDVILAQPRGYPDAAVLRARIAIEEGNVPFARRLLGQQITLVPGRGVTNIRARASMIDAEVEWNKREGGGTVFGLHKRGAGASGE